MDALVEVPYGAFPHECYGLYEADFDHFDKYVSEGSSQGAEGVRQYLDRYVYNTPDHKDYLSLFGAGTLERKARDAQQLVGRG